MPYPDSQPKTFPNQFGQNITSSGLVSLNFGFQASMLKIVNDGAGPLYLRFDQNGAASTAAGTNTFVLSTADGAQDFHSFGAGISGLAYATTSTVSNARVGAWG